jgi:hypothetical protein
MYCAWWPPGSSVTPVPSESKYKNYKRERVLTIVNVFLYNTWNSAVVHGSRILRLERRTIYVARTIERTLQRIALPSKEIIAMVCIASAINSSQLAIYTLSPYTHPSPKLHTKG